MVHFIWVLHLMLIKLNLMEKDRKNQQRVHAIAEKLSDFDPTVIIVEQEPKYNEKIQREYSNYVNNPDYSISKSF